MLDPASYLRIPENALFDRKSRLLVVENAALPEHTEHRKDFVRHVVALANYARLSGRHAALVFGVDDAKHQGGIKPANGIGILNQSAISSDPVLWPVDDDSARGVYWQEHVQGPYERIIRRWVGPRTHPPSRGADWQSELKYHLEMVPIDDALVAALVIEPMLSEEPFFVRDHRDLGLETRHFVRVNDSSVPVGETEARRLLTKWTDAPYLPPAVWRKYLESLRTEVSDALPQDLNTPDAYQDIYVESLNGGEVFEFRERWRQMADSDATSSRFVVFLGEPGTGKTSCLKRSIHEQAAVALTELNNDDELLEPRSWIPVYVPMKRFDGSQRVDLVVANRIVHMLANAGERTLSIEPNLLTSRQLRFIVAIDAVDEIPSGLSEASALQIDAFAEAHAASNHAVTSRETRCPESWKQHYPAYRMRPLTPDQIHSFLGSRITQEQLNSPRMALLLKELASLLCIPRLLHAFLNYLEQHPVPSAGMAVDAILEEIWRIEAGLFRGGSDSVDRYRSPLREYAIRCIEEHVAGLNEDEDLGNITDHLNWYLNAGLLKKTGERWPRSIGFSHLEYLDSLVARALLLTEIRSSPTYQSLRERIESALARHPERRERTYRYLIHMAEADLSTAPWNQKVSSLSDPVSRLSVIAERRKLELDSLSLITDALADLDRTPVSEETLYWIQELLQDPNPQVIERVLEGINPAVLALAREQVIRIVDQGDYHELRRLGAQRLLEIEPATDRTEIQATIISWLQDHTEPAHVEDTLTLVEDFDLTWASDAVHDIASNDSMPYSSETRVHAAKVLSQIGDPRGVALVEQIGQPQQTSDTEVVVDDSREEDFQTTLSAITSGPSGIEDQTISQEEL